MILYFSGTGNSRHMALKLSEMTGDKEVVDMGEMIKNRQSGEFESERPYVFAVPTYGWRVPRIVREFILKSKFSGSKKAYFVLTCGDSTGNAAKHAEKLCKEKGFTYMGCAEVKMPENYIALFAIPDKETSARLIKNAECTAEKLSTKISAGERFEEKTSIIGAIESGIVNDVFYKFIVKSKGFRVTDDCIGCGLCEKLCPLNNISIVDGKPTWGQDCTHCMACICRCPKEAIEYKNASVGKRRYCLENEI